MSTGPSGADAGRGVRRWNGRHGEMSLHLPAPHVAVLTISGHDVGEFGPAPMRHLEECLREGEQLELFIDARAVAAASIDVSGDWARWLARHQGSLERITMLTGSRFIAVTAAFVRRFAELEELMRITSAPDEFDRLLAAAVRSSRDA